MEKKKLIFFMVDMDLSGANLCLINLLKFLDYKNYSAEVYIIKEHEDDVIKLLPKEVKVTFLYKDNNLFDIGFFHGLKKCLKEKNNTCIFPFIINKMLKNINTKNINKLKMSLRRKYVPNEKYDVAISFDEQSFRYMKKFNATKKIVCYHHGEVCTMESPDNKPYNFCDYVVAQCEQMKKDLAYKNKCDENKIKVIHNFFDNDEIINKSKEFQVEKDRKLVFSTCARIIPLKRIDMIPFVCRILLDKGIKDFKWYIVGYPEKEKYMAQIIDNINKTGTEDYIEFTGRQTNPFPYIKVSDIYVQTSNIDAWPRTVMEAMILGVPVLCTKTMGGKEQINPGVTGELCELDDEKDLADKLIFMINNLDKYAKIPFRVDNEKIMEQYYEIF